MFPWGQRSRTSLRRSTASALRGASPSSSCETQGALNVADRVPGAVTVFVPAPLPELEQRLRERATESSGRDRGAAAGRPRAAAALQIVSTTSSRTTTSNGPRTSSRRSSARAGSCSYHELVIHPRIDELLEKVDSGYAIVIVAAKRARQINNYRRQLSGTSTTIRRRSSSPARRSCLTMALEEVAQGKLRYDYSKPADPEAPLASTQVTSGNHLRRDAGMAHAPRRQPAGIAAYKACELCRAAGQGWSRRRAAADTGGPEHRQPARPFARCASAARRRLPAI